VQAIKRQEYGYLYGGACEYVNYPVYGVVRARGVLRSEHLMHACGLA
jgi:hypothetical protein